MAYVRGPVKDGGKYSEYHYDERGRLHNDNGWAVRRYNDELYYSIHGVPHRLDGPAIIYPNGDEFWFTEGFRHRVCGPAKVTGLGAVKHWYAWDKRHRVDGPAFIAPWAVEYWYNGELIFRCDKESDDKTAEFKELVLGRPEPSNGWENHWPFGALNERL